MANKTINQLPVANTIDGTNDYLPIYTASSAATQGINRNTLLGLSSAPVGLTDSQTLTNKILTSPTINGATLSGTLSGTYTIGGTPTFPSSVVLTTASQTLTNKILTSPTINSPTITNATLSADAITGYTTSNTGTIYGISVTTGTISGSVLQNTSVQNAALASGIQTSKFSNPYKFSVWQATAQSVDSSLTTVIKFDTTTFDTGTNYSSATGKLVAPIAGFYYFISRVQYASASYVVEAAIAVNGTVLKKSMGVATTTAIVSGLLQLNANDYVQVLGYSATTQNTVTGTDKSVTYFDGFLVSAT